MAWSALNAVLDVVKQNNNGVIPRPFFKQQGGWCIHERGDMTVVSQTLLEAEGEGLYAHVWMSWESGSKYTGPRTFQCAEHYGRRTTDDAMISAMDGDNRDIMIAAPSEYLERKTHAS